MLQKIYILILILAATTALAQIGTIKGNIKDEKTGEGIIGANVVIEGATLGASTDLDGNFAISKIKTGKYNLVITYISYRTKTIYGVEVHPDQSTVINATLQEDVQELENVIVTGKKQTDTDISVVTELKKSDLVAVGISSQQIKLSQDRDAAQVIRRLPGVTIVGNRFVNVRGLSERYSTVMLNGIIAPSTEVDSKAFAFDLIPSNMLDRMLVFKSGSADLPGEFAGADIAITTKSASEEKFFSVSVSGSYRANTTGKKVTLGQDRGRLDWLGMDDGTRGLPSLFPSTNLRKLSFANGTEQNQLISATKSLPNTWGIKNLNAAPDFRVNIDFSRIIRIGGKKIDNITSVNYAMTNQRLEAEQNYYDAFSEINKKSTPRYRYNDIRFAQVNRIGAVSNFSFEINPSNRIEFRNFYNQQGQIQSTFRTGTDDAQSFEVKNQSLNYYARSIYSGQLSGKQGLSDALSLNWTLGYNNTNANQPDYRRIRSQRDMGTEIPFDIVIPSGASSFDAGRFYSKLNEQSISAAGNIEYKLNPSVADEQETKLIGGFFGELKKRTFDARWFAYNWLGTPDLNLTRTVSFDQIFAPQNVGTQFVLNEGTNIGTALYDRYDGHNQLLAGYAGIVTPFADKFRMSAGLRVEHNVQQIDVYDENGRKKRVTNSPLTMPMPFSNVSYEITEKMLVRLAYSKTVNRPVFRELAPFNYYDFDRNADMAGEVTLSTAKIDNVDLSWELYPTKAEKISFGAFYKHFKSPIEQFLTGGSNLRYSFLNAVSADSYGIEIEVRKSFENLPSEFLNKFSVVLNGALIKSKVEIPVNDSRYSNLAANRPMQGQSPYVANASLFYNDSERGWQISAAYNVFGKRIFAVGDKDANPNQYEMPRHQIDLTISKQLTDHFELKFGVQDFLNQKYRLIQDSNHDNKITAVDETIQSYRWGQYTTLGMIWKL